MMTIRRKLILLYSGLLALVILAFGLTTFAVIQSAWIESLDRDLTETAVQIKNNSRSYSIPEFGGTVRIRVELPQLDIFRASGVLVEAWSIGADGKPEFGAASDNLGDFRDPLDAQSLGADAPVYQNVRINNTELRVLTWPIRVIGQEGLFGNIQVAASLETVNQATRQLSFFMLGGGILAVLGSLALGWWLSNQTLNPIEAITEAADSISTAKDLGTRIPWNGPMDERGRLISVFNHMMDRLEHLFGAQQRLVADVSHELRTPLTAIRGNLDLARRYGMDTLSMEAIEDETARMQRLVNDLLTLARADFGGLTLDMTEIDVDTIVTEVFKEARLLATDRNLLIKITHIEPIRIKGNPDRLKQLLLNLVSNAIKFTPNGGQISFGLRREGDEAVLQVSDTGVGIQPEDLERIFDRFYQADSSRTRVHDGEGSGLGLSIAKWIAEAHGGTIGVQSTPSKETTFTVRVPVLPQPPASPKTEDMSYSTIALQMLGLSRRKRAAVRPGEKIIEVEK
ncbi:MAG: HAMP domain-containing histidine kinase [Anaerolineae bacterium]|nr:HAMP domain-containing histidine kinase [Anaerolineae bacterium]